MRRQDAEFVRHTLQELTLRLYRGSPKDYDTYMKARTDKAAKILQDEEKAKKHPDTKREELI